MRLSLGFLSRTLLLSTVLLHVFLGSPVPVRGEVIAPTASYFIGPHEAGNLPNIGDKVSGDPMVIILRAGDAASWRSTLDKYQGASPVVIRIYGVDTNTTVDQARAIANDLNNLGLPDQTIIVFGNEINNLQHEWKSHPPITGTCADISASERAVINSKLVAAGAQYAELFKAFSSTLSPALRAAPSPLDVYNCMYPYAIMATAMRNSGVYDASIAKATVANAYEIPRIAKTADSALADIEAAMGRSVDFLTEFGYDPEASLYDNVNFVRNTNPPRGLKAATLIPNSCDPALGEGQWLYYVKGQVYTQSGTPIRVTEGNSCEEGLSEDDTGRKPLFVFPQSKNGENPTDWTKYLANSQVYCAPAQVNWPSWQGTDPRPNGLPNCTPSSLSETDPLNQGIINNDPNACETQEYPAVEFVEQYNLQNFTLPLFRNQSGGISIESDLSRVNPDDTLAAAAQRNARSDYAPQFYLSSPQMQCLNAVRYLDYVNGLCEEYGDESTECVAKDPITLPDGKTMSWSEAEATLSEDTCLNFSPEIIEDTKAAQLVRSLQTSTPKVYKMGFLVQHNYLFDGNEFRLLQQGQYLGKALAAWLKGETFTDPRTKEQLIIVPVWYQSGITTNEYNRDQLAPYPIDPETVDPANVTISEDNFRGPFWQTYAPVLPLNIQEKIFATKAEIVKETYRLTTQVLKEVTGPATVPLNYRGKQYDANLIIPCEGHECIREDQEYLQQLRQSFPDTYFAEMSDEEINTFLIALQKEIVWRVNAGTQKTEPYSLDRNDDQPPGPLSERKFDRCDPDRYNAGMGASETAEAINYQALQPLADEDADQSLVEKAIKTIKNEFMAKITWDKEPLESQFPKSYSYLVLPDESIDIDVAQAYITPMFLSPQMYDSIMKGENPIYPWKTDATASGNLKEVPNYLSAFLRSNGYDRNYTSEERGYVKMERVITQFGQTCSAAPTSGAISINPEEQVCSCTSQAVSEPFVEEMGWEEYPNDHESEQPSVGNGCRQVQYVEKEKSTVKPVDILPEEKLDSNLQVPGKTIALHEYLRRMAFTPHYLIQPYQGLESFYQNGLPLPKFLQDVAKNLSSYFAQMSNMSKTYGQANSAGTCGTVYVTRDKAQQYANELRELISPELKANMLAQNPRAQLYGECGGQDCVEFILNTVLEYPVCNGDRYVNPYLAIAIGMTETGGLQGTDPTGQGRNLGFHFGCSPIAFSSYNENAMHDGMQCVVQNATPNEVINPLMVWNNEARDACVDVKGGGAPLWSKVRQEQTVEDGLACMVMTFHRYCQSIDGNNIDVIALEGNTAEGGSVMYNYANFPGPLVARTEDLITLSSRAGTMNDALRSRIRTSLNEMLSGCSR